MWKRRRTPRRNGDRAVLKAAGVAAAGSVALPALTAASLVTLDWVNQGRRGQRKAPDPGTFQARVEDSGLRVYTSGAAMYDDSIAAIDSAQRMVLLKAYIWKDDEVGQRFMDAVNRAAERGVSVFVLYDGFANMVVPQDFYRQFSARARVYRLPALVRPYWKGPLRQTGVNHSKILVVDDQVGFVGGYNIGSLYADQWRDTHMRVIGPQVWGLRHAMARTWNEVHPPQEQIPWIPPRSWESTVEVVANLPVQLVYPIRQMYLNAIDRAQSHIWLTTPYFIPDQQILGALVAAARRGVDVRIMLPKESNHIVGDWVSAGFFGQLLRSGVTLLLFRSSMLHAKTATIDGIWSTVGTANIDRLSLSFSYETNIEVIDRGFAGQMETMFTKDSDHCEILASPEWSRRHTLARALEVALIPLRPIL